MKKRTPLSKILYDRQILQVDMAQATGISGPQVNRLANGRRDPTVDELRRLAKYLRVPQSQLKD